MDFQFIFHKTRNQTLSAIFYLSFDKLLEAIKLSTFKDQTWTCIAATGDLPSGRDGHSMTLWGDKIVIFAGKLSSLMHK